MFNLNHKITGYRIQWFNIWRGW